MASIPRGRLTARLEAEFAVFMIGMRITIPAFGLGRAGRLQPASGAMRGAAQRRGRAP